MDNEGFVDEVEQPDCQSIGRLDPTARNHKVRIPRWCARQVLHPVQGGYVNDRVLTCGPMKVVLLLHKAKAVLRHFYDLAAPIPNLTFASEDKVHGHPSEIAEGQVGPLAYLTHGERLDLHVERLDDPVNQHRVPKSTLQGWTIQDTLRTKPFVASGRLKCQKTSRTRTLIMDNATALVITDPQNDFLSPEGVTWGLVGESVTENNTVTNIQRLLQAAKTAGIPVFVSPHYYYPTDHGWQFGGTVEAMMHDINMFDRSGQLDLEGFEGSGADWHSDLADFINDGETVVTNPHKVYGPETNDLALQLRKRGINKVILTGMSANLCVEAHLRQLTEDGFQVTVVKDATAAAKHPELGDGYQAALVNFGFIASEVLDTDTAIGQFS